MVYLSLILSIGILFFVIQLMFYQRRFDWLNGVIITGALIGVLLDIDTLVTGRKYDIGGLISLAVLVLWFISGRRKPLEKEED
jgi:hypothetical protein